MNKMNKILGKENKKLELCINEGILGGLNTYISDLMNELWDQPKIIASIIENSNIKELKIHLAPLFANNFYENILSSNSIENNLLYVFALLIDSEIKNLKDINEIDTFLEDTPCGIMLEELIKKNDIQEYLNMITKSAIETLESKSQTNKEFFKIEEIANILSEKQRKQDFFDINNINDSKEEQNSDDEDLESELIKDKKKNESDQTYFNNNYNLYLDKNTLIKLKDENKYNKNMYDYLNSKLSICEKYKNINIFANEKLFIYISKFIKPETLIIFYHQQFFSVIDFIEKIVKNILNNIHIIPNSIKYICKIISEFISRKFSLINTYQKNAFIAKFFFGKLLIPYLLNPILNNYKNENSLDNMKIICKILQKYISGDFFIFNDSEFYYTPFNWYFIRNFKDIFNIFQNLTKFDLPEFIDKLINNELPLHFKYDYFRENQDEIITMRSILYNIEQIWILIQIMDKNKNKILNENNNIKLQNLIEKLMQNKNQKSILEILNNEKKIDINIIKEKNKKKKDKKKKEEIEPIQEEIIHYFLHTKLDINKNYDELLNLRTKTNFSIKKDKDKESKVKNNIIKVKNLMCNILYNCNELIKPNSEGDSFENTEIILNNLYSKNKSPNSEIENSIPIEWYIKSFLKNAKKLPEYLTKNDFELLYDNLKRDINKSIKDLDFEVLSIILNKIKNINKEKIYYEKNIEILEDYELNQEVNKIIKEYFIPIDIKFEFENDSEKDIFSINQSQFKEKEKYNEEKKRKYEKLNKVKLCINIENFPKKFPNLVKYQEMQDADIFEIQKNLNMPSQINKYMDIIQENLISHKIRNSSKIKDKIYDYIMDKIYNKIFPVEPNEEDNKIFQKSVLLNWIQLNNLMKTTEELDLGNFENDVLKNIKLIDTKRSLKKKLINLNKIFNAISFIFIFNDKDPLKDNMGYGISLLKYSVIKAQALRLDSNIRLINLYIGDKMYQKEGNYLKYLKHICDFIPKIQNTDLIDVSFKEFVKNCNDATKERKF